MNRAERRVADRAERRAKSARGRGQHRGTARPRRSPEAEELTRRGAEAVSGPDITGGVDATEGWAEAEDCLRRAIALEPTWGEPHSTLAALLSLQGRDDEAERLHRRALALSPGDVGAHAVYGLHLRWRGDLEAAERHLRRALELAPRYEVAASVLADIYQLRGEYERAWRLLDRAFRRPHRPPPRELGGLDPSTVPWDGRPLDGRSVVLSAQDGLGDSLMLARYAPLVAARGGEVVVGCPPTLAGLLGRTDGVFEVVAFGPLSTPPVADAVIGMSSLPYVFRTRVEIIPDTVPYLRADPRLARGWAERLAAITPSAPPGLKVGLCWAGSAGNPHNWARSMRLEDLAPLWRVPGARFYALQQGPPRREAEAATAPRPLSVLDTADYDDTAAAMMALDLIISVDSSPAHAAGGLGRPTWVLLPETPDWFWGLEGSSTPWYPTATLFRQARPRAWAPVVEHVAAELAKLSAARVAA